MPPEPSKQVPDPNRSRWTLYTKMGFGAVLVFGLVGNCRGDPRAVTIFVILAITWTCCRIFTEAIEAFVELRVLQRAAAEEQKRKDDEPPIP